MSAFDDPLGTGGERTVVAFAVGHIAVAYTGEPDEAGTSLGACSCGWTCEAWAPAVLTWPTCRAHVIGAPR